MAARWLCIYGGLRQREAAKVLGLRTGAAVSAQLRTLAGRLAEDRPLRKRVEDMESGLAAKGILDRGKSSAL